VLGAATATPSYTPEERASCDTYLTAFIREGRNNDITQVTRLQKFLRDFENASTTETGIYDKTTLAAVHAFQTKYASDILTPWGIKESTGYVYLTTRKKVNEIFCNFTKAFPLTAEEQAKIDAARAAAGLPPQVPKIPAAPSVAPPIVNVPAQPKAPDVTVAPKAPATSDTSSSTDAQLGAVSNILDFLKDFVNRFR
jgi:hypothetical protein